MFKKETYNSHSKIQTQQHCSTEINDNINCRLLIKDCFVAILFAWSCFFILSSSCSAQEQAESPVNTVKSDISVSNTVLSSAKNQNQIFPDESAEKGTSNQTASPKTISTQGLEQILSQGTVLEIPAEGKKTDWNEALNYWETALRENPSNLQLNSRYYRARINYDIVRRLADKGYVDQVSHMSSLEMQQLLLEILIKIQKYYVDSPNWSTFSRNGLVGVQQALRNPVFQEQFFPNISNFELTQLTGKWLKTAMDINVQSSQDIVNQVEKIGLDVERDCNVNGSILIMEYICGLLNVLDPYTGLLTTSQLSDMYNQINGSFVGIGVELKVIKGEIRVVRPITGSPAYRAGIQAGDTILAVNDNWVKDFSPEQISNFLQGIEGSKVTIVLARKNVPNQTITIVRQNVKSPSIDNVKIIDSTSKIGYMRITHFQKSTADELDVALQHLYNNKMQRLVIDLRGNPGGLLQAAIDASERFLSQGVIVSTKGKNPSENNTYIVQKQQTWNVPLVILIDKDSASAAEIFSGAMRDHHRATIVGTNSYGKGSVQGIFPLKTNSMGLRMTTAKFYSPLGKGYTRVGVSPDLEVRKTALLNGDEDPLIAPAEEDDAVLQAGLNAAREME